MVDFNKDLHLRIVFILGIVLLLSPPNYALAFFVQKQNLRGPLSGTKRVKEALLPKKNAENVSTVIGSPSLEELESKIFAVHATPILPKDGIMISGAQDKEGKPIGNGIPAFRPTLHFALGELARDDSRYDRFDTVPYAIISPLKNLTNQLVNVFPTDTFIIGNYQLSRGDILIVPKGTDISTMPTDIHIFEYDQKEGLRNAVESAIRQQDGWHINLPKSFDKGRPAMLEGRDINSIEFFGALFKKYPFLSYGSHAYSEKGEAFRFFHIERSLTNIIKPYIAFSHTNTIGIQVYRALILHHLSLVEQYLSTRKVPAESMEVFNENKKKLFEWLNLADIDLEIRQKAGKTLAGMPEWIKKDIVKKKSDLKALRSFVYQNLDNLPYLSHDANYDIDDDSRLFAIVFCMMSPEELKEFKRANSEISKYIDTNLFNIKYAIKRWLIIKTEQAKKEKLDRILEDALGKLKKSYFEILRYGLITEIQDYLTIESNRLEDALAILREPVVKKYLADTHDIEFKENSPQTLDDLLHVHPVTKELFTQDQLSLDKETGVASLLLAGFTKKYIPQISSKVFVSFREAMLIARGDIREVLAERLDQYNKKARQLWGAVGLGEEFVQLFPSEEAFWESELSLVEIYKRLKDIAGKGYKKSDIEALRASI